MISSSKDRLELLPQETRAWFLRFYEMRQLQVKHPGPIWRVVDFLAFQHNRGFRVREITWGLLSDYCAHLGRQRSNQSTREHYRSELRQWLRFLYREGVLLFAFHRELTVCQGGKRLLRRSLTLKQVQQVLRAPDLREPAGLVARVILELAYGSGLRKGELVALNLADIDLVEGLVTVRTSKNGRGRVLPLTRASLFYLGQYLEKIRPRQSGEALFLDGGGQRMNPRHWARFIRRTFAQPLKFPFHLHLLRHSSATHLLQAGVDVATVQAFLGHRCLSSTERYTHLQPEDLIRVQARCHPRQQPRA